MPRNKTRNLGATSLKRRRRAADPMREYDLLPSELRGWLATAALPWSPRSARRVYARALARTGDSTGALAELDRVQRSMIVADAGQVWGRHHPAAQTPEMP